MGSHCCCRGRKIFENRIYNPRSLCGARLRVADAPGGRGNAQRGAALGRISWRLE